MRRISTSDPYPLAWVEHGKNSSTSMTEGTAVLGDGEPAIKHLSYARARARAAGFIFHTKKVSISKPVRYCHARHTNNAPVTLIHFIRMFANQI